jgi:RNA polymerase II subunit A-like phosphatase
LFFFFTEKNPRYKRLDRLFPLDQQRHVLVLDDNNVWGDCPNVLRVIPYLFFNVMCLFVLCILWFSKKEKKLRLPEHFPGEFVSNTESDVDVIPVSQLYAAEAARDSHLSDLLRVLERVHELFFLDPSRSVVEMFGQARREVLAGCSIVLSGIYAMNTRRDKRWMEILAQDYGAQVQEEVVPGVTTHVVAAQDGTQKVIIVLCDGVFREICF